MHNENESGFSEFWISNEMKHQDFCDVPMLDACTSKMVDEKYPPYDFTDLLLVSNGLFLQFINRIDKKEGLEPFCSTEKDEISLKKYLEFQGELTRE